MTALALTLPILAAAYLITRSFRNAARVIRDTPTGPAWDVHADQAVALGNSSTDAELRRMPREAS